MQTFEDITIFTSVTSQVTSPILIHYLQATLRKRKQILWRMGYSQQENTPLIYVITKFETTEIVKLYASRMYWVAQTADGRLYLYGSVSRGVSEPTSGFVEHLPRVERIAPGDFHILALTVHGTVYVWGSNWFNECGNGAEANHDSVTTPTRIEFTENVVDVYSMLHTNFVITTHAMYSWGYNVSGQTACGHCKYATTPLPVPIDVSAIAKLSCGSQHALCLQSKSFYIIFSHMIRGW
jgi:alpha-tubulin suppressor-like RCC1 family protein